LPERRYNVAIREEKGGGLARADAGNLEEAQRAGAPRCASEENAQRFHPLQPCCGASGARPKRAIAHGTVIKANIATMSDSCGTVASRMAMVDDEDIVATKIDHRARQ
jgi:hypothetical protein